RTDRHRERPHRRPGHQDRAARRQRHHRVLGRRRRAGRGPGGRGHRRDAAQRWGTGRRRRPGRGRPGGRRGGQRPGRRAPGRGGRAAGDVLATDRRIAARRRADRGSRPVSATATTPVTIDRSAARVPLTRLVRVELRKMFDTRSGFWLMVAIIGFALLATVAVIAFIDPVDLTYGAVSTAIGVPMSILLPVMAILTVTSEWSQRTGLTTFSLVPARGRVIGAKAIAAVLVGVVSMLLALAIGALGNLVGAAIRGTDLVWDATVGDVARIVLINVLGLLIGFMLGVLIRNSPGAIVGYFVYMFVVPTVF